jgi:hypothetical protein
MIALLSAQLEHKATLQSQQISSFIQLEQPCCLQPKQRLSVDVIIGRSQLPHVLVMSASIA